MFRPGAILKIAMTNFVTYTYVEFFPGPNLNFVLGPNGTGKSTIVAAIILGLGGNPKIIGRGTKVSEYVKRGFSNAQVEILLQGCDKGDDFTITREFDLNDRTVWKLNGKTTTQKEVCSLLGKLRIQVDNLCQFLPQDRVQDFTKMNKQELLKATKRALCKDDLLQKQQTLIEKHESHKGLLLELGKKVKKLEECRNLNTQLEGKVKNFKKKKECLNHIRDIERKMAWVEYESLAVRRDEIKADKAQAMEIYERHRNELRPMEKSIADAQKIVGVHQTQGTKIGSLLKSIEVQINNHSGKIARIKENVAQILNDMQVKIGDVEQKEFEINSLVMKLQQLRLDGEEIISKYGDETVVKEKEKVFERELREISSMIAQVKQLKLDANNTITEKNYEIGTFENQLRRIENIKQRRLEWLRKRDIDAYNATLWLRENKSKFSGQIYEPMVTELNVTKPENALHIENIISLNDKVAFVCTSKADMNLFVKLMREQQHLRVNVIYSGEEHAPFQSYQPAIPIEQLKKYGFYIYAHSLLTGPEAIMKYLCRTYHIHCVPIGDNKTSTHFQDVPREIHNFFSDEYKFSTSFSRYTGEKSTRQTRIESDGSLSVCVDVAQLDRVRQQIREANEACETRRGEIQELDDKIVQLNARGSNLTAELRTLKGSQQQMNMLGNRMREMEEKLRDLRRQTDTKESITKDAHKQIEGMTVQILAIQAQLKEGFKRYTSQETETCLNTLKISVCEKKVTFLRNKALELQQRHQEAEESLNRIKEEYKEITARAKAALDNAKKLSKGCTPVDEAFQEFRKSYDELDDDLEALMAEKDDVLTKIDCLHAAGHDEMKEYETRVDTIKKLEGDIAKINEDVAQISDEMDRSKQEYMQPLEELVEEISRRFGAAFETMGYAGEVLVYTGTHDRDYEHYGLSIMVTYRNDQRLQELNSTTQSGGEKTVATATYLLSLQELTPVPFRCVDEINQGMDAINERKILELLMEFTSRPDTSQYFLITPKLLENLKFTPTTKIHFVVNGPFVISQQQWNAAEIC